MGSLGDAGEAVVSVLIAAIGVLPITLALYEECSTTGTQEKKNKKNKRGEADSSTSKDAEQGGRKKSAEQGKTTTDALMYQCVVLTTAALRTDFESSSQQVGVLTIGEEVQVLEERTNEIGQVRVRCSLGWTSLTARDGTTLMEKLMHDITDCTYTVCHGKEDKTACQEEQKREQKNKKNRKNKKKDVVEFENPTHEI